MKKLMIILLILAFSIPMNVSAATVEVSEKIDDSNIVDLIQKKIQTGYSEYYDSDNFHCHLDSYEILKDTVTLNYSVHFQKSLRAKSLEELPYFQGYLTEAGLTGFSYSTKEDTIEALSKAEKVEYNEKQISYISDNITSKFDNIGSSFGKETTSNFSIKAEAEISDGKILLGSIQLYAENFDEYIPIKEILPKSYEELYALGKEAMAKTIKNSTTASTKTFPFYYFYWDATYYARVYTSNPTSCYDDGSSCGIYQDRTEWNNNTYNYYSTLKHNDCADYVSQCLAYGGIPQDSTWKNIIGGTRTVTWVNTGYLKNYMLGKGYWTVGSSSTMENGDVIYTDSSHVVIINYNDTVTHQYCGHTNDRWKKDFSYSSSFDYYEVF